jgi:hypothetical protein
MDRGKCSPRKAGFKIENDNCDSCYKLKTLREMARGINKHTKYKITGINRRGREDIWHDIHAIMNERSTCKSEMCWIKDNVIDKLAGHVKEEVRLKTFRPIMPLSWEKNINEWLSTIDIAAVLKQYDDNYPEFKLHGPTPIDFHLKDNAGKCKVDNLCAINLNDLLNGGIRKIGIVFNTDPHYKSGQHWISLYVDLYDDSCIFSGKKGKHRNKKHRNNKHRNKKHRNNTHRKHSIRYHTHRKESESSDLHKILHVKNGRINTREDIQDNLNNKRCSGMYYFDSQGKSPPSNVLDLMEDLCKQGDNCNIKFQKLYNDVQHQKGTTECGIYSIHFLTTMLQGIKFQDYIRDIKGDEDMEKLRKHFFVPQNMMN